MKKLSSETIEFLKKLKKNNNRDWFGKNKSAYEKAMADFAGLVDAILPEAGKIEPGLKGLNGKDCIFRIYRDVRFSKNKEPYKANFSAVFTVGGRKMEKAGLYLHLEPGKSFIAGGIHLPQPPVLAKIRQEIAYNGKEFRKILAAPTFKKFFKEFWDGDKLSLAPKGYEKDHPEIEYLKLKSFVVSTKLADGDFLKESFIKQLFEIFKAVKPIHDFLNRALD